MEQSFIGHAKNVIKSCDNFDELVEKLADKMDGKNKGSWSIVAHTSTNVACQVLCDKYIKVDFGGLVLEGYLEDDED